MRLLGNCPTAGLCGVEVPIHRLSMCPWKSQIDVCVSYHMSALCICLSQSSSIRQIERLVLFLLSRDHTAGLFVVGGFCNSPLCMGARNFGDSAILRSRGLSEKPGRNPAYLKPFWGLIEYKAQHSAVPSGGWPQLESVALNGAISLPERKPHTMIRSSSSLIILKKSAYDWHSLLPDITITPCRKRWSIGLADFIQHTSVLHTT